MGYIYNRIYNNTIYYGGLMKKGFTLSEILITLGIIGVVSAITMPSVIQHFQKQKTVNSLKKMYSTLWQAAQNYQAKNNVYFTDFDTSLSAKDFMEEYFNPSLKIIKTCNSAQDCWNGGKIPKTINGTTNISVQYGVIFLDGSILGVNNISSGIIFYFDVDGIKGHNKSSRDIFNFYLINTKTITTNNSGCVAQLENLKSGIYPGGMGNCYVPFTNYQRNELLGNTIHRACNKEAAYIVSVNGDACATVIMQDGWKISDDYPW